MTQRRVRAARLSDAGVVTDLVQRAYQPYVERIGKPPAPMTCDYERVIGSGDVWVIEAGDRVDAVLVLHQEDDHLLIDNVAVDPALHGVGLGAQLLAFAEDAARQRGLPEIRLYTNEHMTENIGYYPRRGYQETDRRLDEGFIRVFFTKRLTVDNSTR